MTVSKFISQHFAIGAQLALMAIISVGLTANTIKTPANTSEPVQAEVFVSEAVSEDISVTIKPSPIAAPTLPAKPLSLNLAMRVLSPQDATFYRALFAAQEKSDWKKTRWLIDNIEDRRLMGSVLADRFARRGASLDEQAAWLRVFSSLPEAETIYAAATTQGGKNLQKPNSPLTWSGGSEIDSATSFNSEQILGQNTKTSKDRQLSWEIQKNLSQNNAYSALQLLRSAENELSPDFIAEAEAIIAASFFRSGETIQATALANKAARAEQPLGLWIKGLLAWKANEYTAASAAFTKLATRTDLTDSNSAAAHFWAYRAFDKKGNEVKADKYLKQAAAYPQSLYGLLAGQLLGKNPIKPLTLTQDISLQWDAKHQEILASDPAGWRALALVQVGQNDRAEAELRRMNPQGDRAKQEAMLALASFVPMPALTIRLASLKTGNGYNQTFYPLLPWKPAEGFKIDRALLFALARQESLFDPMAISSRGARGLMQIMPATANYVITKNRMDVSQDQPDALFDPSFNMTLGQKYVRQLANLPHIGNNLLLILAAYNGGPGKTLSWIEGKESADPLLFLESIPTRETRQYISRVLPHYWAYRARLGKPLDSLTQLSQGLWPTASLLDDTPVRVADASK